MAENEQEDRQTGETISNRGRVRVFLIEPLRVWGIQRPARMKVAEYEAMLSRLCDGLAYMSEANLRGLLDLITRHATGKGQDEWPPEVTVRKWALGLQSKPPRENPYAQSLIRSEMGRKARALGYHVELFQIAVKIGPPPSKYDLGRLDDQARENQRKRERVEDRVRQGVADPDDRRWLEWYCDQEAQCLAIMDEQREEVAA